MSPRFDLHFDKTTLWRDEAKALRAILLDCGLTEELKWRQPCYTHDGRNIAILQRMKPFLALAFFRGALMDDPAGLLQSPGENSRHGKRMTFTDVDQVHAHDANIRAYVAEAIRVADAGLKVEKLTTLDLPDELHAAFVDDPALKQAFFALTPGRQRGYALHFAGAKQSQTRANRIAKYRDKIMDGLGFHD